MSSIGPQLPPHLQKRKRTPDEEDAATPSSPPVKMTRRSSDNNSDDDEFRPSAPAPSTGRGTPSEKKPSIGPSMPPKPANSAGEKTTSPPFHKQAIGPALPPPAPSNNDEIPLDSDSDSDIGPSAPPKAASTKPPAVRRVLGPAPPPADLSQRPTTGPDSDSSDDDDNWGPALPSVTASAAQSSSSTSRFGPYFPAESHPAGPAKRDDWMVAPPTSSGYSVADPTKLKSRKFASGRSVADKKPGGSGPSSIWTETPEEKMRRVTNAVLGREDPAASSEPPAASSRQSAHLVGTRRVDESRIRSYTEETRGRSLVEEHQALRNAAKQKKAAAPAAGKKRQAVGSDGEEIMIEEEDDPSKRAFDKEKDMAVSGHISGTQRQQMLNKATDFGGRFQKGSYL
ncbi:hypothetical protein B0H63DRAFT_458503 [Podospora didyma]|uniref:DUF3752 domain-containing protein n=1 Tax=Podospora didyma TaxID=330526 RepID=A0AAE0P503_9PEZI|nr:hypothetical protein B0H63DRAFT_458503 [Podospora didyma]